MFYTNFRIKQPSATPSLLQSVISAYSGVFNFFSMFFGFLSPVNFATASSKMNSNIARAFCLA